MQNIEVLQQANATLGESPVWDERNQVLFWGDLKRFRLYRYDSRQNRQTGVWQLPYAFGCHALTDNENVLAVVTDNGYELLNLNNGVLSPIIDPEKGQNINCYNDGKVDPQGRFWVGSLPLAGSRDEKISNPTGKLYSLNKDGGFSQLADKIYNTNGMAWSPDETLFYHIDSWLYTVWVYDYEIETGAISNKREFIKFEKTEGNPDGMCIDIDGCLWIAMWDGWAIQKVSSDGKRLQKINLPVQKPTSCALGGDNLNELFITSASCYLSTNDFVKSPSAGALLKVNIDTRGFISNKISLMVLE